MILSTTNNIDGRPVKDYLGIVTGETIIGANIFKDFFASIRDVIGGRSGSYEKVLREAKDTASNTKLFSGPSRKNTVDPTL